MVLLKKRLRVRVEERPRCFLEMQTHTPQWRPSRRARSYLHSRRANRRSRPCQVLSSTATQERTCQGLGLKVFYITSMYSYLVPSWYVFSTIWITHCVVGSSHSKITEVEVLPVVDLIPDSGQKKLVCTATQAVATTSISLRPAFKRACHTR